MCLPRAYFCISFFHTLFAVQRTHISLRSLCTTPTSTRPDGAGVAYGHYEEPPRQIRDSRLPIDMQGRTHPISGYRLVHWSPDLKPGLANNHMEQSSRDSVLTVAAVLSFFTARSVRLDNESSKLLLLTPHNDTVYDLQDALGLPASNYPPTLYDFYLTILYKTSLQTNAGKPKIV